MRQKIENKLNEYVENLLSKPRLTCDEYLLLRSLHKELLAEEHAARRAEARATKINNMINSRGENYELQKQEL